MTNTVGRMALSGVTTATKYKRSVEDTVGSCRLGEVHVAP